MPFMFRIAVVGVTCALLSNSAVAQQAAEPPAQVTAADYAHAETFMTYNPAPLVLRTGVGASWLPADPADRFWYRVTTENGVQTVLVDPAKATKTACDLPA